MKNVLEFLEGTVSKYPERYAVEDEIYASPGGSCRNVPEK